MSRTFSERVAKWEEAITEYWASTRTIALMRIGIAFVAWAELGGEAGPREAGWALGLAFYVATAMMAIGLFSRLATFAAAMAMWSVIHRISGAMHHHTYLMAVATTCLSLTPCGRSFSVDRWLAVRKAERAGEAPPEERANIWAVRLIGLQMSAVMFWGGYNKLTLGTPSVQYAFMTGDRLEQTLLYYHSLPVHQQNWASWLLMAVGTSVVCFELSAGFGFWIPKVRPYFLLGAFLMTSSFQILLNVGTFGLLAACLYLAFVPPETVHRLIDDLFASDAKAEEKKEAA